VHRILIEEQPHDLMAAGQGGLSETQGAPGGGRMRWGEEGDGEFHMEAGREICANDKA
jgi:hypothetical protein